MRIGDKTIGGADAGIYVIAEIGGNHNGDPERAAFLCRPVRMVPWPQALTSPSSPHGEALAAIPSGRVGA